MDTLVNPLEKSAKSTVKTRPRRIVVVNVFGSSNRGDAALIEALVEIIKGSSETPPALEGIAFRPEEERPHLPEVVWHERLGNSRSPRKFVRRFQNCWFMLAVLVYAVTGLKWLARVMGLPSVQIASIDAIRMADLVISCPGGYLEDSNPSFLSACVPLLLTRLYGKDLILAPQSVGPVRARILQRFVAFALGDVRAICVRESASRTFVLDDLEIPAGRVHSTPDLALTHEASNKAAGAQALARLGFQAGDAFLGCTVVDWNFPLAENGPAARERYIEQFAAMLQRLHDRHGLKALIFNQVKSDLGVARRVREKLGDWVVVDEEERDVPTIKAMIGASRAFVGSRFHSCIFALTEGVPIVSIAYLPKSTGIMEDLGLSHRVFSIYEMEAESVAALVDADLKNPRSAKAEIRQALGNVRSEKFVQLLKPYL